MPALIDKITDIAKKLRKSAKKVNDPTLQELITDLMRFKDLRVYSANSNRRWTEDPAGFGEQLQVAYEVKGSVLRAPDRIRLAVQLVEVGSGRYVWSETYDRPLTTATIFDVREEIAAQLAGHLAEPYGIIREVTADLFRHHRPTRRWRWPGPLLRFRAVLQPRGQERPPF